MNIRINRELLFLSKILTSLSPNKTEKPLIIRNYGNALRAIKRCYRTVKNKSKGYKRCTDYCEYFNYNSNSPIIEGDPLFYSDMIAQIESFVKRNKHLMKGRLL